MKKLVVDGNIDAGGTCLQGEMLVSYDILVKTFGEPTFDDKSGDDKVKIEWTMMIGDKVATIYDWKNYDMTNEQVKQFNKDWHVGGHKEDVFYDILYYIKKKKAASKIEVNTLQLTSRKRATITA